MKVLSLFDGISICHLALDKVGIPVEEYYASEIKPIAIKCTQDNYSDTVQIGDIRKVSYKNGILSTEKGNYYVGHIDLLAFGFCCQSESQAMKKEMRIGLKDMERSGLFYEAYRIFKEVKPTYFIAENVGSMLKEDKAFVSEALGVEPIRINSKLVCAALRDRYYWTNISGITQPEDKGITLQSILTSGWTDREKARTLLCSDSRPLKDKEKMLHRYQKFTTIVWDEKGNNDSIRYLNQTELERCQTVPEGYTKCLTRNEAANVLGDSWTTDVIAHIFSFINTQQNDLREVM